MRRSGSGMPTASSSSTASSSVDHLAHLPARCASSGRATSSGPGRSPRAGRGAAGAARRPRRRRTSTPATESLRPPGPRLAPQQAQHGQAENALARTRLSHEPEDLAARCRGRHRAGRGACPGCVKRRHAGHAHERRAVQTLPSLLKGTPPRAAGDSQSSAFLERPEPYGEGPGQLLLEARDALPRDEDVLGVRVVQPAVRLAIGLGGGDVGLQAGLRRRRRGRLVEQAIALRTVQPSRFTGASLY